MADYLDIRSEVYDNDDFRNRFSVAVVIAAEKLISDAAVTAAQQRWAGQVVSNTRVEAMKAMKLVVARVQTATPSVTTTAMLSADDATLQGHVDAVVDALVVANEGV